MGIDTGFVNGSGVVSDRWIGMVKQRCTHRLLHLKAEIIGVHSTTVSQIFKQLSQGIEISVSYYFSVMAIKETLIQFKESVTKQDNRSE